MNDKIDIEMSILTSRLDQINWPTFMLYYFSIIDYRFALLLVKYFGYMTIWRETNNCIRGVSTASDVTLQLEMPKSFLYKL
jgi:hypothetical protein